MCGIGGVYFHKKHGYSEESVNHFCDQLLLALESRGRHATGFVSVGWKGAGISHHKSDKTASEFIKTRPKITTDARIILLHTRHATQGAASENKNNHPVKYRGTYTVHNGHINNDDKLFKDEKVKRLAEVDSEIIPALINKYGFREAARVFEQLRGGFATATIKPGTNPDQLLLARGGYSPLVIHTNDIFTIFASEEEALKKAWKATFVHEGKREIPGWVQFENLSDGEMRTIKGAKVEKSKFQPPPVVRRRSGTSGSSSHSHMAWPRRENFGGYYQGNGFLGAFEDMVKAVRECGVGVCQVLPPWQDRDPEHRLPNTSFWCSGCRESVADTKDSVVTVTGWGKMCADCATFARNIKPNPVPRLEQDILDDLEMYASAEAEVYRETLKTMGDKTGYDPDLIDYIMWRLPSKYVYRNRDVEKVQSELRKLYLEEEKASWKEYLWIDDVKDLEPVRTDAERHKAKQEKEKTSGNGGIYNVFLACGKHGNIKIEGGVEEIKKGCPECLVEKEKASEARKKRATNRGSEDTLRIKERSSIPVSQGRPQLPCVRSGCDKKKWMLTDVPGHVGARLWICYEHKEANEIALKAGRWSNELHKWFPHNKPDECYKNGCGGETVATLYNGNRACHAHARRKKRAKFDTKKPKKEVVRVRLH
jgi:hypothetical protein